MYAVRRPSISCVRCVACQPEISLIKDASCYYTKKKKKKERMYAYNYFLK